MADVVLNSEENRVFVNTLDSLLNAPKATGMAANIDETPRDMHEALNMAMQGQDVTSNFYEGIQEDPGLSYRELKQATHDLAYEDSAEGALANKIEVSKYEHAYPTVMTPDQATSLARELGRDLKFDKNVTEGQVRYSVLRQDYKDFLKEQIAEYSTSHDYSVLQKLGLVGASISGSVGALEALSTLGISAGLGAAFGTAAPSVIAALGSKVPAAQRLQTAITLAQKAMLAEKRATAVGNDIAAATKYINTAKEAAGAARSAGAAESLMYDAYRMSQGAVGARASLWSTAVPFGVDAVVSDIPRVAMMSANNSLLGDDSFTTKDAVAELLMVGGMGAALPVAGTLLKGVSSAGAKTFQGVSDYYAEKAFSKASQEYLKGHQLNAEAIEQVGNEVQGVLNSATKAIHSEPTPALKQAANTIQGLNVTEDEFAMMLEYVTSSIRNGRVPNLANLPNRTLYMSNIPGMYEGLRAMIKRGYSNQDIFDEMIRRGIKIAEEGKDALTDGVLPSIKFADEAGALGRDGVRAFSPKQSADLLMNIYRYNLTGDVEAGMRAQEAIDAMTKAKRMLDIFLDSYNRNIEENKASGKLTWAMQKTAFQLSDGSMTDARGALNEILDLLSPVEEQNTLNQARTIIARETETEVLKGHPDNPELLQRAQEVVSSREAELDKVMTLVNDKQGIYNLTDKNGKGQTMFLRELSDDIGLAIEQNQQLLDSDRILTEAYTSPDELLMKLEHGDAIPELQYSFGGESANTLEMRNIVESNEAAATRLEATKATFANVEQNAKHLDKLVESATRLEAGYVNNKRTMGSLYVGLDKIIATTQDLLTTNFDTARRAMISAIQESDFFNRMMQDIGTRFTPTQIGRIIRAGDSPLRKIVMDAVVSPVQDKLSLASIPEKRLREAVDLALDSFATQMEKDTSILNDIVQKVQVTPADTAENIGEAVSAMERQAGVINNALEPLVKELGIALMEEQNIAIQTKTQMLNLWETIMENPAMASEALIGHITNTPLNIKGAALSVENLADATQVMMRLERKLIDLTPGTTMSQKLTSEKMNLREYAFNPDNYDTIKKAILIAQRAADPAAKDAAGIATNSEDAIVAQAFLDTMAGLQKDLYRVGSGKQNLVKLFNSNKLNNALWYTPAEAGGEMLSSLARIAGGTRVSTKQLTNLLNRFAPSHFSEAEKGGVPFLSAMQRRVSQNYEEAQSNFALYLLKNLDLDAHFNRYNAGGISLNELRDSLLDNTGLSWERFASNYDAKLLDKALNRIADGILGVPANPAKNTVPKEGLIGKLGVGSNSVVEINKGTKSKFLEDLGQDLIFKNDDATLEAMNYFGHDSLREWFEADFRRARRAYAILSKVGPEPKRFMEDMIDMVQDYAKTRAVHDLGKKAASRVPLSDQAIKSILANTRTVCGTDIIPANTGVRISQIISKIVASPMIITSGVKSLTDYFFQHQALVTTGLKTSTDMGAIGDTLNKMVNVMKSRELSTHLFLNRALRQGTILELLDGNMLEAAPKVSKFNEWTPGVVKWEQRADAFANKMINSFGWVGPITEYNRANAAMSIMEALGDFASTKYAEMNPRLQGMLAKHNISEWEWDNIFAKYAVSSVDEYLQKTQGITSDFMGNHKMFFADALADLDDNTVQQFLEAQGYKDITAEAIERYRANLCDKASVMINAGANEMTSLPTARSTNALNLWTTANTPVGELLRVITKYQSFAMAVTQLHWGRRLAQHVNMADPLYKNIIQASFGVDPIGTTRDALGFVVSGMLVQLVMDELVSSATGNYKSWTNEKGDFNFDKLVKAMASTSGITGPIFDAVTSSFEMRGTGGGLAFSVAPTYSNILRNVSDIYKAGTRESTEGQRPQAIAAALGQTIAAQTGISKHILTQAFWSATIGDYLNRWSMGPESYYARRARREREGYQPNWARQLIDYMEMQ